MINPCPLDNNFKFAPGEIDFFLSPLLIASSIIIFFLSSCGSVESSAGGTFGLIKRIFSVLMFC